MSFVSPSELLHHIEQYLLSVGRISDEQKGLLLPHRESDTVGDAQRHALAVAQELLATVEPVEPAVTDGQRDPDADHLARRLAAVNPTSLDPRLLCATAVGVALHHWDIQSAIGSPDTIDAPLAYLAINHALDAICADLVEPGWDLEQLLHLHATDFEQGEWLITVGPTGAQWRHGHAKGDVAARGPVADLLLFVTGRIPPSRLEIFGEPGLLDSWQALPMVAGH